MKASEWEAGVVSVVDQAVQGETLVLLVLVELLSAHDHHHNQQQLQYLSEAFIAVLHHVLEECGRLGDDIDPVKVE